MGLFSKKDKEKKKPDDKSTEEKKKKKNARQPSWSEGHPPDCFGNTRLPRP